MYIIDVLNTQHWSRHLTGWMMISSKEISVSLFFFTVGGSKQENNSIKNYGRNFGCNSIAIRCTFLRPEFWVFDIMLKPYSSSIDSNFKPFILDRLKVFDYTKLISAIYDVILSNLLDIQSNFGSFIPLRSINESSEFIIIQYINNTYYSMNVLIISMLKFQWILFCLLCSQFGSKDIFCLL